MKSEVYHIPVMRSECLDGLSIKPNGTYVDLTFGGGGHSRAILEKLGEGGRLVAFDQDEDAVNVGEEIERMDSRLKMIRGNFRFVTNYLHYLGVEKIDGVLADLGVSSHQFDEAGRGFTFREDAELDMRMNREQRMTAGWILEEYEEKKIEEVFRLYGELKEARGLARAVVRERGKGGIWTSERLRRTVGPFMNREREKKDLAKVFQALRIEVNDELGALRDMMEQLPDLLKEGGRLVVMTYHSLEDRLVKNFMRSGNVSGVITTDFYGKKVSPMMEVNRKVITPSEQEVEKNPRARSAKLRIGEKIKLQKTLKMNL